MIKVHVLEIWTSNTEAHGSQRETLQRQLHFTPLNSQVYSRNGPEFPSSPCPLLSSLHRIWHEGHSGRGRERRNIRSQRVVHAAATHSVPWLLESVCPCRGPEDRPPLLCSSFTRQTPAKTWGPSASDLLSNWNQSGEVNRLAAWARAQESGGILTPELKGHTLAALGSYKNGKSRFFTI